MQNEDGVQQTQTDSFTSGVGNLDGNWTTPTGGTALKIVTGPYVEPTTTSTYCSAIFTGGSFNPSQYSEVTLETLTGTLNQSLIGPMVMASTTVMTAYEGHVGSPTATSDAAAAIYKRVAGMATQIGPTATVEPQVGDVWRLSVTIGNDGFPCLSLFQNGFLILQIQDQSVSPLTTGSPGMFAQSSVAIGDAQISLWAGGNANVIPPYGPVGIGWSPVDSRIAVLGFGPAANTGIADEQGNIIYSAQDPPYTGNSQTSDNTTIPPTDSRKTVPADDRVSIPENSRVAPPFGEYPEP